jgi:BirA family biotin operon repressor/biotin-[acetyl-CoA-carboxylase] ligase
LDFTGFSTELLHRRDPASANLVVLPRVPSTNDLGRRIADEYLQDGMAAPPVLVVAWEQTGGRGRRGRSWQSAAGKGVYASLVVPLDDVGGLSTLPLLVAVGLATAVNRRLGSGAACCLKWPNDLMVGERKLAGVLIDRVGDDGVSAAVVGFGLNCRQDADELAAIAAAGGRPATSLALEAAEVPSLAELTWELVDAVRGELERFGDVDYAARRYGELSLHRAGDRLRYYDGAETVEGIFLGFDRSGFLRLEVEGEERRMSAGEVLAR